MKLSTTDLPFDVTVLSQPFPILFYSQHHPFQNYDVGSLVTETVSTFNNSCMSIIETCGAKSDVILLLGKR
jgi:ligand-binding SRPBCC domain-containing protein